MNALTKPYFVPGRNFGQIGAGKVVPFSKDIQQKWIPLPKGARAFDHFVEFEVSGDSLEDLGIFDGHLLTCRRNFELSEIRESTICIVYIIPTCEQTAKMVKLDDETVTLFSANPKHPPRVFFADEIQILAIAVEARWQL